MFKRVATTYVAGDKAGAFVKLQPDIYGRWEDGKRDVR
jgi:hypothetical protein